MISDQCEPYHMRNCQQLTPLFTNENLKKRTTVQVLGSCFTDRVLAEQYGVLTEQLFIGIDYVSRAFLIPDPKQGLTYTDDR